MNVQLEWEDRDRVLLTCAGQMGWGADEELVKRISDALVGREQPHVLIDLEAVEMITSAGLGSLLQVRRLVAELGGRLVLAAPSPLLVQLFRTVGLDRHMTFAGTLDDARVLLEDKP